MPLPVFATRRGRDADNVAEPGGGVPEPLLTLSPVLVVLLGAAALDARKVLLTDTALKAAGFLMVDPVRPCVLSPSFALELSVREASVSDPPLALASA